MKDPRTGRSVRRIAFSMLLLSSSNIFRLVVQFALFPVLARLLGPVDYGLMALAMPVVLFALTLSEGGMGPALLRSRDPDLSVQATMFWTAIVIGLAFTLVLIVGAPMIAVLVRAEIVWLLWCLAPILVLSALCSVPSVHVQKSGKIWIFALGDVASTTLGAAAALHGAWSGWSVWSLVAQQLMIWIIKTGILAFFVGVSIKGKPDRASLRYLLGSGLPVVGANLLMLFVNSIDLIFIGRFLGVQQLGFYALAYQIVRIPETVLSGPVYVSFMPAIVRLDMDRPACGRLFVLAIRMMLGVAAPLMIGMALTADLAVVVLVGTRWSQTAPLLMILAPAVVAQSLGWVSIALLLGRGRSKAQLRLALVSAVLTLAGLVAGLPFGLVGVAAGVAVASSMGGVLYLTAAMREVHVKVRDLSQSCWTVPVATTIMAVGVLAVQAMLPVDLAALYGLAAAVSVGSLLYVGAMRILAPDLFSAGAALFRRQRPAAAE